MEETLRSDKGSGNSSSGNGSRNYSLKWRPQSAQTVDGGNLALRLGSGNGNKKQH